MKILIVCPRLCHGGAERVAVELANGFAMRGNEVLFFTDLFEEISYSLSSDVKLLGFAKQRKGKVGKWLSAIFNARRFAKEFSPDVIIGIMSTCSFVGRVATFGLGIPVIATEHDSFEKPASAPMGKWAWLMKFILNKLYSHVTVLTEVDRKVTGKKLSNVTVMPNPLALPPLGAVPQKQRVILTAGRVDVWHCKGFDVLMKSLASPVSFENMDSQSDTLASLMRRGGWKLQIAGVWREDSSRDYLLGIAREHGVDDLVEFLGFVEDIQSLYQRSSVFVLSSRYEGFGLVLIEAMSQGCAPVACDYKGRQREIINPSSVFPQGEEELSDAVSGGCVCNNGILCEPDNAEQLAVAIARMISDDKYRMSVQQNAISRSRYYSIENTIDRWEQLLNKVI